MLRLGKWPLPMISVAAFLLYACDAGTRIEGEIRLDPAVEAPDAAKHTLFIAAFTSAATVGGVWSTGAIPEWVEFAAVANEDFDPAVSYALGGGGGAHEARVVAWWKTTVGQELVSYAPIAAGDVWGVYPGVVFEGQHGEQGGNARGVDLTLDRVFVSGSSGL